MASVSPSPTPSSACWSCSSASPAASCPAPRSLSSSGGIRRAADLRVVDVYVARLRGKLEPDPRNPELILTVRGTGYASQRLADGTLAAAAG